MRIALLTLALVGCADDGGSVTDSQPATDTGTSTDTGSSDSGSETFPSAVGGDSSTAQFALVYDTIADADADGRWEPGELATLTVTMRNDGADDFNYPQCTLSSDDLASGQGEFPFFGLGADDENLCSWQLEPLATAVAGDVVEVDVIASRLNCTDDCPEENTLTLRFQLEADPS
ncbi:MAG: hypothetical protein KC912_19815 [Proteobacteria bacterium]|nr:hypothetical protein [Pseudomonadota bacterium]